MSNLVSQSNNSNNNALNLVDLWGNISQIYKIFSSHCYGRNLTASACAKIYKLIYERSGALHGILCESLSWHTLIPSLHNTNANGIISGYFHIFSLVINHANYRNNPLTKQIKEKDIFLSYPSIASDAFEESMNKLMIPTIAQKEMFDIIYSILCLNQIEFICTDQNMNVSISITINKTSLPFAKQSCVYYNLKQRICCNICSHKPLIDKINHLRGTYVYKYIFCF